MGIEMSFNGPPSAYRRSSAFVGGLFLFALALACPGLMAQNAFTRPYRAPQIAPARLDNSARLQGLIRAGKVYLTVQDALALAIENNLDLEIDRYGPLLAASAYERALGGGPVRGVPSASAQVSSVDAGIGVNGSTASAGLLTSSGIGGGGGGGAASIQQIGAITPNLDPVLQNTTTFSHLTQPQANTVVSQTTALVDTEHTYNTVLQQGLLSGGLVQFRDYEQYLKENAPSDVLNPVQAPHMDIYVRHNFMQGFGIGLNNRTIRIAKLNMGAARDTFRSQLIDLVASVLNLYWDLVSAEEEVKARRQALNVAEKFLSDTRKEIGFGVQARYEMPRVQAEAASRQLDLRIAQAAVVQQSELLKAALTRRPDAALEAAEIVPLDSIQVPAEEELPPLRDLVQRAMAQRPDVAAAKVKDEVAELNALGTVNPLLPTLQGAFQTYNRGAAGTPQVASGVAPNPQQVGGFGSALGQVFRRDYPNTQASVYLSIPLNNRQAQGDYGVDQLQLRQSDLSGARDNNQIVVDISNQMSALRQARARYAAASNTRSLQEQLLEADQKRFASGSATLSDLVTDQRNLSAAQLAEISAMASYAHARVALDQVLGETLGKNGITSDGALAGR
jgi:outer membrane protein TolC